MTAEARARRFFSFFERLLAWGTASSRRAVVLAFAAIFIFYIGDLTNQTAPGGDGARIHNAIDLMNTIDTPLPLWNPYKLGGVPYFADPERFGLLGLVIGIDDPYRFLKINFLMVGLAFFYAGAVLALLKKAGLSWPWAALGALIMTTSEVFAFSYVPGRMHAILVIGASFLAVAAYLHWRGSRPFWGIVLPAIATGYCLSFNGYYALLYPGAPLFVFSVAYYFEKNTSFTAALVRALRDMAGIVFLALGLFAVFLVPLISAMAQTLLSVKTETLKVPAPWSFIHVFLPLDTAEMGVIRQTRFPFVSLLLIPGIFLLLSQCRNMVLTPRIKAFLVLLAGGLAVSFLGVFRDFGALEAYTDIPLLGHIRNYMAYFHLAALGLVFFSLLGLQKGRLPAKRYIVLAICLLQLFVIPSPVSREFIGNKKIRIDQTQIDPAAASFFAESKTPYRLYCPRSTGCGLANAPMRQQFNAFSTYFPAEHRTVMSWLTGKAEMPLRPHWVKHPTCAEMAAKTAFADMLNLRYMRCDLEKAPVGDWKPISGTKDWFARTDWQPSYKVLHSWRTEKDFSAESVGKAWTSGTALLPQDIVLEPAAPNAPPSEVAITSFGANTLSLKVEGPASGILFLPEYFDADWKVDVDSKRAETLAVYGVFRGVAVSSGAHEVVFTYAPPPVRYGLFISLVFWVLSCFLAVRCTGLQRADLGRGVG